MNSFLEASAFPKNQGSQFVYFPESR